MKYLVLIYTNPEARRLWEQLPQAERSAGLQAYAALNEDLAASGEMTVAESLADPSSARHVTVRDGQAVTTDGPFAEAKEQLAGFYLVECDSIDRATEIAARIPEAHAGVVEVRPAARAGAAGRRTTRPAVRRLRQLRGRRPGGAAVGRAAVARRWSAGQSEGLADHGRVPPG